MIGNLSKLVVLFLGIAIFQPVIASQDNDAEAIFEKIKGLAGEWREEGTENDDFVISFTDTAGGSVVLESWLYNGHQHSLTAYHLDNDNLIVTHYCPQGNQPRLSWQKNSAEDILAFSFKDVTNFTLDGKSRLDSLSFTWLGNGKLQREETYLKNGEQLPSSLTLVRK
ncbi:hypothetical protein QT397_04460 [Microbulbifer sp. MKSA007]|nr:hypothetical protein QT397_04460 [Microbulbifer sp. MKSA007]